ncbi:hypothetical protein PBAL39_23152 [Pedobacter sp. BAL39]|uniref:hypothetical protein n=1 Tax=Pedobacter sp. BAL39 TaxID=391596 RepID=UPI0001559E3E|nr:hypothetical protein [Pedobacter sp. BAL39]EDM35956.1 hypothetical protein PBAL39_23152 [Pedobacter sp. BAL39]
MIRQTLAAISLLTLSAECFSQSIDSIPKTRKDSLNLPKGVVTAVADKFAVTRPLNIEFANAAAYNYKSERGTERLPDSKVRKFEQTKVSANINFIRKKTWLLTATLGYRGTSSEAEIVQDNRTEDLVLKDDFHYLFSAVTFTYFSTLFKKRTFYSSTFFVDGSDKHVERVKGIFTGTMLLTANKKTKMTVGVLVNVDPSAQTPFIPTFSYEHKFSNGLIADITLPRSMYLRKFIFKNNGRLSAGMELDQTTFYLYNLEGTNQKYEYRQLDINPGLVYEHAIGKYFMLTGKSGIKLTPNGRLFRKEDTFGDPLYQITPDPTFYFNVGVSFNPFSVFGKKR